MCTQNASVSECKSDFPLERRFCLPKLWQRQAQVIDQRVEKLLGRGGPRSVKSARFVQRIEQDLRLEACLQNSKTQFEQPSFCALPRELVLPQHRRCPRGAIGAFVIPGCN